ncbi:hypothetical protein TIFTF001_033785 [Ficus carica]|uniref:Uncharacterized protein n=1 Tax=Ficus carica TaxID=3494 RepID=A0AA88DZ59_FICCA|nr:hypothetical protein TIFTF001_033785 [Ficus carica]
MDIGDALKDYEEENIEGSIKNIQQNVLVLKVAFDKLPSWYPKENVTSNGFSPLFLNPSLILLVALLPGLALILNFL